MPKKSKKKFKDRIKMMFALKAIAKKKGHRKQYKHFDKKLKGMGY